MGFVYSKRFLILYTALFLASACYARKTINTQLLIFGGGTSGTTAAIQASRMGVKTILIEETNWLGGMLTSAGVSAIDGNHNLPSGLWAEFRAKLYQHYGGAKQIETGWVSNTLFEPSVGNKILKEMVANPNLTILYQTNWQKVNKIENTWQIEAQQNGRNLILNAKLIIDATELGDIIAYLKIPYSLGMDSRLNTKEVFAPEIANNIVQDITYVVILKDYGKGTDKTIAKPPGYDAKEFACACDVAAPSVSNKANLDCDKMLNYGKLPNHKYMINWPKCGNDIYLNLVELSKKDRLLALDQTKLHSLRFVYYLQTILGYKNLGLADDEYFTKDKLPLLPYYRESRRVHAEVNLTVNDLINPYQQENKLYRTGIAVGDYPIDHHHAKNNAAPEIDFTNIKIPSYSIPMGTLIPKNISGILVAEKSIGVSNIVAGTTRLQPVVLLIGQAVGALAAIAIKNKQQPSNVNIREVQQALLSCKTYLLPYIDVKPTDIEFEAIQKIGVTGILVGKCIPYQWANQTWFYPEQPISEYDLCEGFKSFYPQIKDQQASGKLVNVDFASKIISAVANKTISNQNIFNYLNSQTMTTKNEPQTILNRGVIAMLIANFLDPFSTKIDFNGNFLKLN